MNETTKIAVFVLMGVIIGAIFTMSSNPPPYIETFCQKMIEATQNDRGYKDTEILAGCFEQLTGRRIELK